MPSLFEPLQLGALTLPNRIIMAPLTRCRAGDERVPNALMAKYYVQRAAAGLIISEATSISPQGVGYPRTPGIWSKEQVAGWRLVTNAVHEANGRMVLQLWHVGRISDPFYLHGGTPVAPSAVRPAGHVSLLRPKRPFVVPRALTLEEIHSTVEDYRRGAQNALEAGFDGVEIHGANGYLIDEFLQDSTNLRTDEYGGSLENRTRFLLEVVEAVSSVWGSDRVGVHLFPGGHDQDMGDSNPAATFGFVAGKLAGRVAFIVARQVDQAGSLLPEMKRKFGGPVVANDHMTKAIASRLLSEGTADAVAFGRDYLATPDLVHRFRVNAPLNEHRPESFYGDGPEGYIDYPVLGPHF